MSKSVLETLKAARKLIRTKNRWLNEGVAQKKDGSTTFAEHPEAYKFCSWGALIRVTGDGTYEAEKALEPFMENNVAKFNDRHTHAEVLAAFDAAIAKANQDRSDV